MSIRKIVLFSALTTLLVAGSAAAQTTGSVNVSTSNPASVSAGNGVQVGTFTLTGVNGGATVTSLPITINGTNGGSLSNLTGCQVYDPSGNSITTGSNVVNAPVSGGNSFVFNSPFTVFGTNSSATFAVRCNVASTSPSGSTFGLTVGSPILSNAAGMLVNLDTAPSVPAGSQDVTLANIALGSMVNSHNVASIPLTITAGTGASTANLTDCKIRSTANLDGALSNTLTLTSGAQTSFALAVPQLIVPGSPQMLALTCDVQPATPVGSTYTISINPANVGATNASTGAAVTASGVTGFGPQGLPGSTSGTVIVSAAGSGSNTGGSTGGDSGTPGVPNTGAGGTAAGIILLLAAAGLAFVSGSAYLRKAH